LPDFPAGSINNISFFYRLQHKKPSRDLKPPLAVLTAPLSLDRPSYWPSSPPWHTLQLYTIWTRKVKCFLSPPRGWGVPPVSTAGTAVAPGRKPWARPIQNVCGLRRIPLCGRGVPPVGTAETAVAPGRKPWGAGIVSRLDEGGSFAAALQGGFLQGE